MTDRGKMKIAGNWLADLDRYLKEGWKLAGWTKKDAGGFYWLILERNRQGGLL